MEWLLRILMPEAGTRVGARCESAHCEWHEWRTGCCCWRLRNWDWTSAQMSAMPIIRECVWLGDMFVAFVLVALPRIRFPLHVKELAQDLKVTLVLGMLGLWKTIATEVRARPCDTAFRLKEAILWLSWTGRDQSKFHGFQLAWRAFMTPLQSRYTVPLVSRRQWCILE